MPAVLSFVIAVAYWPGVSGASTSPRWIIAAILFPAILFCRHDRIPLTISGLLGLLFVGWSLASVGWSEHPVDTIGAGWQFLVLVSAFCVGATTTSMRPIYIGAALGLLISDGFAVAQFSGWVGPLQANVPAGLFVNRNFFAEISALIAVALISERLWLLVPVTLPGLFLTGARGALLGLAAALTAILWRRSRWLTLALVVTAVGLLVALSLTGNKIDTAHDRIDIWRSTIAVLNWHGYGLGSFYESAPRISWIPYRFDHAYNEFLEAWFETGFVGFALMIAFWTSLLFGAAKTERLIVICLMVEACFEFPFHLPGTALLGCVVAGHLARDQRGFRCPAGLRGMAIRESRSVAPV